MNDKEQSRLEKLQQVGSFFSERLDRSDLLLLLRHDGEIRQAILQMVDQPAEAVTEPDEPDCTEEESFCPSETQVSVVEPPRLAYRLPAEPAVPPARDSWREELSPELELLAWVQADEALCAAWLGQPDETAARQLVRLIAVASQWEQVLLLWDRFAARCKQEQRPASMTERQILKRCLALHNLIWQGRQACLQQALPGADYEPRQHDRGTVRGDTVSAEWLPGLLNAAGQLQKKPLVRT
ncbi:hypothetical protein [Malikia sp.]|uniref:hypothetical protein n=1 Tax=Malikia sp. TaxID=2070706 RepID=UPI002632DF0E|nr:hypothetical protein [Malikia sp.]MDD2728422.1 hypothetical protein [Malikia sp.]